MIFKLIHKFHLVLVALFLLPVFSSNSLDQESINDDFMEQQNELLKYDILVESLGGDIPAVELSALKKTNLDSLLENIILLCQIIKRQKQEQILTNT